MTDITYAISPPVTNDHINALFLASWPDWREGDFQPVLSHSLLYVCAYEGGRLVGFVNVAWDGGIHGFILDTTVHPDVRRRGIGVQLVRRAAEAARTRGLHWLHVDYEPRLKSFYEACGFFHTEAGLMHLNG
nr:putative GCN5-related N-acetyltransferase [uncultured bacterium]